MCFITGRMGPTTYFLAKCFMYCLFVLRLKIIYGQSFFAYQVKTLYLLMAVIIIYSLGLIVTTWLTLSSFVAQYEQNSNLQECHAEWPVGITESQVLLDLIANALCCYLFIRPLRSLLQTKVDNSAETQKDREEMYVILRKYSILTLTAVISTFALLMLVAITLIPAFAAIDIVINCFCIMMFNTKNEK